MSLADDLRALRDRAAAELIEAYDYYEDSRAAWSIAEVAITGGHKFTHHSLVTGTATTEATLLAKGKDYLLNQLAQSTFLQFISIFEAFLFDLLRLWLTAHPYSLANKKVDVQIILDAPDKDAILRDVINRELNERAYGSTADWFRYLEERARLGCPSADEIAGIAEAKATRDVLIHNRGVANCTYESKAGPRARYAGQRIDVPEPYHRGVWELLRKVAADASDAALAKAT
jgi:hypothetical protein